MARDLRMPLFITLIHIFEEFIACLHTGTGCCWYLDIYIACDIFVDV